MGVCGYNQNKEYKTKTSIQNDKNKIKNESTINIKKDTKNEKPKLNSKVQKNKSKINTKIDAKKEKSNLISKDIKKEIKNEPKIDTKIETKNEKPNLISKIENKDIIRECHVKGTCPIIPEQISEILKKSTARIEFNDIKKTSTGFFMKINIKGDKVNFILTCNHSITQEDVDSKQQINIYIGKSENEEKIVITLDDKNRLIKTYDDLNVTLIQVLKEDNIKEKRFLYPDLNYENYCFSIYKDSEVFTAGFPDVEFYKEGRHISSGIITNINDEYNFEHNCDTRRGSSGSPIINKSKLVIGIHFGGDKNKEKNFGTFIGAIINKLNNEDEKIIIKKEEKSKKVNKYSNFIKNDLIKTIDSPKLKKECIDTMLTIFNDPECLHQARKMANNPKVMNFCNQSPFFKNTEFNFNDIKELYDEDNSEELNDLKKSLENIKNKLNEEDKKE